MLFKEIENKAKELQNKRYYRSNALNQNKGLTDFIKELEKQAKEKNIYFDIVGGSPKLVIPYKTDNWGKNSLYFEDEKEVLFTEYVGFIYDNFYYYIQIDDNPFFEHYYSKIPLLKDDNGFYYIGQYYSNSFDPLAKIEDLWSYNQTTRNDIKNSLLKSFEKMQISRSYKKIKSPYYVDKTYLKTKKLYFNI